MFKYSKILVCGDIAVRYISVYIYMYDDTPSGYKYASLFGSVYSLKE